MVSATITADCFWSAGYLASALSILASASGLNMGNPSSIDLAENDVLGADDGDHVCDHMALRHLVDGGQMRETRRADLQPVRLVGTVGHDIDAELALGSLDPCIGL